MRFFLSFICLSVSVYSAVAQTKKIKVNVKKQPSSFKLVKNKPSVHVTFENHGNFTSARNNETYDIAWFRLHNNFKETISFCYYDLTVSPTGKIGAHYEVEKARDLTNLSTRNSESVSLGFPRYDFCNEYKLKSGKTFLFGVPQSQLTEGTLFKIRFYYSWEDVYKSNTGKEPQHYVYFYTIDLPRRNILSNFRK